MKFYYLVFLICATIYPFAGMKSNVLYMNEEQQSHKLKSCFGNKCLKKKNMRDKVPSDIKLIYLEDFCSDFSNWKVEFHYPDSSAIKVVDCKLDVNSKGGATVWFKPKLSGNIMIMYNVVVLDEGGPYDRVSDMNAFWMATDPANDNEIVRDGNFSSYDDLKLYYAGVGGHNNTFTRFRKYKGNGQKPVLKEYTDKAYLLTGNTVYQIKIIVQNGLIRYFLNEQLFWELYDDSPYSEGFFGFRTFRSHQQFSNFKVFMLL